MGSQNGMLSYKEVRHSMYVSPASLDVKVFIRAVDGENEGFVFGGQGVVHATEDQQDAYGGLLFAYDSSVVRLWAPSRLSLSSSGYIISVGYGWGQDYRNGLPVGERNVQHSHIAEVRVVVRPDKAAVCLVFVGFLYAAAPLAATVVPLCVCAFRAVPSYDRARGCHNSLFRTLIPAGFPCFPKRTLRPSSRWRMSWVSILTKSRC